MSSSANQQLLGNLATGLLFIISAPSGTGKTTLVNMLTKEFSSVVRSISCTTRPPRPGEVDGQDYCFLDRSEFQAKVDRGDFLEWAEVFGHCYGTSKEMIQNELRQGKHVVLVIDTQGAEQVIERMAAVSIFIRPPSLEELRQRLEYRGTESAETLATRLEWARVEMEKGKFYDYLITNGNLSVSYEVLRSVFIGEEHRAVHVRS